MKKVLYKIIIYCLTLSFILLVQTSDLQASDDKYLVIHIDGISSELFSAELEAGNLNNLQKTFGDAVMIERGITYFPPFTQVVISRIREAKGIEEAPLLDWTKFDEDERETEEKLGVYGEMRDTISRRSTTNLMYGYHQKGKIIFREKSEKVRYSYEGEDLFNYYDKGYQGEYLTREQWLELTYQLEYPLTPVRINDLFKHPNVGDIVTVLNPPKIIGGLYTESGNHHGLTAQDMTVPVLLKGPDLKYLYDLYSTYVSRLWLGGGLAYQEELTPLAKIKYQFKIRNAGLEYSYSNLEQSRINLFYQLSNNSDLKVYGLNSFVLRYNW